MSAGFPGKQVFGSSSEICGSSGYKSKMFLGQFTEIAVVMNSIKVLEFSLDI